MKAIHVGLVADPASPSSIARRMSDLGPPGRRDRDAWDVEVVSEPFTVGSGGRRHDNRRYLLAQTYPQRRTAVLSLPALGGLRMHARARQAVGTLVSGMARQPLGTSTRPRGNGRLSSTHQSATATCSC